MKSPPRWFLLFACAAISLALVTPAAPAADLRSDGVVMLGKLKSRVPEDWARELSSDPSREIGYRLGAVADDLYDAQMVIRSLGKPKKGAAEEYVKKWKGMFLPPVGMTMAQASTVRRETISGADVTYFEVQGDYKGAPGDPASRQEHARLIGVYFSTPQGAYVIRLFGADDTVRFYRKGFNRWLKAFK